MLKNKQLSNKNEYYFIYLLQCRDNSLYTGYTKNIERRLGLHEKGRGSSYVFSRRPFKLVHWERFNTQREAMQREIEIKKLRPEKKRLLIGH